MGEMFTGLCLEQASVKQCMQSFLLPSFWFVRQSDCAPLQNLRSITDFLKASSGTVSTAYYAAACTATFARAWLSGSLSHIFCINICTFANRNPLSFVRVIPLYASGVPSRASFPPNLCTCLVCSARHNQEYLHAKPRPTAAHQEHRHNEGPYLLHAIL